MYLCKSITVDWEVIHQTHSVLEIGVGTSVRLMVRGDFSFILVPKTILLVLYVISTFLTNILFIYCIFKKFIHGDNIRILETYRSKHKIVC